jgi:hypothetical protein
MRIACWIAEATDMQSEYLILTLCHGKNGDANAPQYYVYMYIACFAIYDFRSIALLKSIKTVNRQNS